MTDQATQAVESTPQDDLMDALGDAQEQEEQEESADGDQEQEEGEQADEGEEQPAVSQKFRVKVKNDAGDDEERDLSLEELAAGYMQSADYTRKTQAAAAQEKQREQQYFQAIQQTTQQAQQQLGALRQLVIATSAPELKELTPELAFSDPARYVQLQAKHQQLSQVLAQIDAQDSELKAQREATERQQREQSIRNSLDYLSKEIPGFNLEKEATKLVEVGKKYRFSEQELAAVTDGRMLHVLHDAMRWRELQAQKPKALQKVTDAPKVIKPSAPQPRKTNQSALDRLKKTGRASELVNFL